MYSVWLSHAHLLSIHIRTRNDCWLHMADTRRDERERECKMKRPLDFKHTIQHTTIQHDDITNTTLLQFECTRKRNPLHFPSFRFAELECIYLPYWSSACATTWCYCCWKCVSHMHTWIVIKHEVSRSRGVFHYPFIRGAYWPWHGCKCVMVFSTRRGRNNTNTKRGHSHRVFHEICSALRRSTTMLKVKNIIILFWFFNFFT